MTSKLHVILDRLIRWYYRKWKGWETAPVIVEQTAYVKLVSLASASQLQQARIEGLEALLEFAKERYDPDTGDYYSDEEEQEFAELDNEGNYVSLNLDTKKKEDYN